MCEELAKHASKFNLPLVYTIQYSCLATEYMLRVLRAGRRSLQMKQGRRRITVFVRCRRKKSQKSMDLHNKFVCNNKSRRKKMSIMLTFYALQAFQSSFSDTETFPCKHSNETKSQLLLFRNANKTLFIPYISDGMTRMSPDFLLFGFFCCCSYGHRRWYFFVRGMRNKLFRTEQCVLLFFSASTIVMFSIQCILLLYSSKFYVNIAIICEHSTVLV